MKNKISIVSTISNLLNKAIPAAMWRDTITCGKPRCRCRRGNKHGPYTYVKVGSGRTGNRYYVPPPLEQDYREAIEAWKSLQKIILAVTLRNESGLRKRVDRALRSKGEDKR